MTRTNIGLRKMTAMMNPGHCKGSTINHLGGGRSAKRKKKFRSEGGRTKFFFPFCTPGRGRWGGGWPVGGRGGHGGGGLG